MANWGQTVKQTPTIQLNCDDHKSSHVSLRSGWPLTA